MAISSDWSSGVVRPFEPHTAAGARATDLVSRLASPCGCAPAATSINPDLIDRDTNNSDDVSLLQAGRDITYANVQVAGPGALEIMAGRNLDQADQASVTSIGLLVGGSDDRPGASIAMMAGVGVSAARTTPSSRRSISILPIVATAGVPLADQAGKVAKDL